MSCTNIFSINFFCHLQVKIVWFLFCFLGHEAKFRLCVLYFESILKTKTVGGDCFLRKLWFMLCCCEFYFQSESMICFLSHQFS